MRPPDRGAERLLARVGVAAARELVQAAAQSREDLGRGQKTGPSRRELDRQREVVEPSAELRDRLGVTGVVPKRGGPRGEELGCLRRHERGDRIHVLACELEPLPARDDDGRPAGIPKRRDLLRRTREEMLEVVEQQHRSPG